MLANTTLNRQIHDIFLHGGRISYPTVVSPQLAEDHANIFKLFLRVDISKEEIDIPVICRSSVEDRGLAVNHVSPNSIKEVVITLFENDGPYYKRTAASTLKTLLSVDSRNRMCKVTTSKGEIYYGGKGFILDKDYNLLLLYTLHGVLNSDKVLVYKTGRIYVNPKVFLSKGLIERSIIKTVIPVFASEGIMVPSMNNSSVRSDINNIIRGEGGIRYEVPLAEIIIADVTDRFIVKPEKPSASMFNNSDMNEYLLEHIDEIIQTPII